MNHLTIILSCAALLVASLIGITLSVSLQTPAVILLGVAAILGATSVLRRQTSDDRRRTTEKIRDNRGKGWLLGLSLIVIGYFVGRACLSPVWDLGIEDLMLILPAGLLYLIAGHAVVGKAGITLRQSLAWVVIVLLLLHLGSCLLQLQGGEGYSLSLYITGAQRVSVGHVTGMYGYYGSFANFAVIAGLLCLSLGAWGRFTYLVRGLLFLLGLAALGLAVWSQSRSAIVSLVVALVVYGVLMSMSLAKQEHGIRRRMRRGLLALAISGGILGVVGGIWVFEKRGGASIDEISYSGVRSQYWAMAAEQWIDYPMFGAGSRSYSYECFRYWSPNLPTQNANPEFVHNEYLQLLADYGLVGLLLILGLLAWHLYRGGKQVHGLAGKMGENGLKRGSNAMALTIAGMCGMTAMAVHICFDFRTHLLANLLLLVCCAVWILPIPRARKDHRQPSSLTGTVIPAKGVNPGGESDEEVEGLKVEGRKSSRGRDWCRAGLALVLFCLGLGAVGLGGQQLWAGLPLVKNKMAKEDGAWQPATVNRDVWIPVLEESLARAPQWRRYQRLGTLHWHEANVSDEVNETSLRKAEVAYLASLERHDSNPIPKINLAIIYAQVGKWQKADRMYASASEMARAREQWFRMHSKWAALHLQWASDLWEQEKVAEAETHFVRAKELYLASYEYGYFYQNKQYVVEYTRALMAYARFLDSQERFDDAEVLFQEGKKQVNWYNWQTDTALYLYYGQHLYEQGEKIWYQRKPEEAYKLMKQAKSCLSQYRGVMKGHVDSSWQDQMTQIEEVMGFLEKAGVGNQTH